MPLSPECKKKDILKFFILQGDFSSNDDKSFTALFLSPLSFSRHPAAVNMPETAESHAVALTTNRFCVMEVTNLSSVYCLWKPQ